MRPSAGSHARPESPSGLTAVSRQEVSERIGLGRSSCMRSAFGQTHRRCLGESRRPLARETSVGGRSALSRRARGRKIPDEPGEVRRQSLADELEAKASTHGDEAGFRAQAWGWAEAPALAGESRRGGRSAKARARGCSAGIGRSRGGARGVFGLQKSTSGAWVSALPWLDDGRRPDPVKSSPLTRRRRRWIGQPTVMGIRPRAIVIGFTRGCRKGRQRLRRMLGPRLRTLGSGSSAQRGDRSMPHQDCAGLDGLPSEGRRCGGG